MLKLNNTKEIIEVFMPLHLRLCNILSCGFESKYTFPFDLGSIKYHTRVFV